MFRVSLIRATGLGVCLLLASCSPFGNLPGDNQSPDSVGDVSGAGGGGSLDDAPPLNAARARIRNESAATADVTVRFIREDVVVHLAFARVPGATITTVASPETVDVVELSGVDDQGRALEPALFVFGVDFNEVAPAEYLISDAGGPFEPPPSRPDPPSLRVTAPESPASATLGSTFDIQWEDTGSAAATVTFFLRSTDDESSEDLYPLGPAIGVALDGINDAFRAVVQGVVPGSYEVVGRVRDGAQTVQAVAPGILEVTRDPLNAAPVVSIRRPTALSLLRNNDTLKIEWTDADPDDNANLIFSLEPTGPDALSGASFILSPPIAEDPDGPASDSLLVTLQGVLPGLYDLVATIDDGQLIGTDRKVGRIRVLPSAANDLPRLDILEPFEDVEVTVGGVINVRWTDSDDNDNALITFLLDPNLGNDLLNGNEVVLASSIPEDHSADEIALAVASNVAPERYRLVGVITDGTTQVLTRAPGFITVNPPLPNGGGDDVGDPEGPQVVLVEPAVEIVELPGELVTVVITQQEGPLPRRSSVFLSNIAYGGSFRADVTPQTGPAPTTKVYTLVVDTGVVPNRTWPRAFDVELETVIEGSTTTSVSPRPLRIRQELEIVSLRQVNYACSVDGPDHSDPSTSFAGIEWVWYGGGFGDDEPPSQVGFWLTADGSVPEDDRADETHRPVFGDWASPNQDQITRATLDAIRGTSSGGAPGLPDIIITTTVGLTTGNYQFVGVLYDPEGSRTFTPPMGTVIEICPPVSASSGDGQGP